MRVSMHYIFPGESRFINCVRNFRFQLTFGKFIESKEIPESKFRSAFTNRHLSLNKLWLLFINYNFTNCYSSIGMGVIYILYKKYWSQHPNNGPWIWVITGSQRDIHFFHRIYLTYWFFFFMYKRCFASTLKVWQVLRFNIGVLRLLRITISRAFRNIQSSPAPSNISRSIVIK